MVVNQKVTGTASSMPIGLAVGALISLLITLAGSLIAAYGISREWIQEIGIGYAAMGILLLSSIAGAKTAMQQIKHSFVMVSLLSGVLYYGLLVAINILFFGGVYQGMGVTLLVIAAGCGSTLFMQSRRGGKQRQRKRKRKHR